MGDPLRDMSKYLTCTWRRASIPPADWDDCTQAVLAAMVESFGRRRFDGMLAEIGDVGLGDVFRFDTPDGPAFFRIVDRVKKRGQRAKRHRSLHGFDVSSPPPDRRGEDIAEALGRLDPFDARIIGDTLRGLTPSEIGRAAGVAPKTVSNRKTLAFEALRGALA